MSNPTSSSTNHSSVNSSSTNKTYLVDHEKVAEEEIEGEVVAINLETGTYYSLLDEAVLVWNKIKSGLSLEETLVSFGIARDSELSKDVTSFVEDLEREGLIKESQGSINESSQVPAHGEEASSKQDASKTFQKAPVLTKYTEMQELLLLDPVHDVGQKGWPNVANDTTSK